MAMTHSYHISTLCRVQQDIEHNPCHSGTCDREVECEEPCMCMCHKKIADVKALEYIRAVLHDNSITWHGDQLHIPGGQEWLS